MYVLSMLLILISKWTTFRWINEQFLTVTAALEEEWLHNDCLLEYNRSNIPRSFYQWRFTRCGIRSKWILLRLGSRPAITFYLNFRNSSLHIRSIESKLFYRLYNRIHGLSNYWTNSRPYTRTLSAKSCSELTWERLYQEKCGFR